MAAGVKFRGDAIDLVELMIGDKKVIGTPVPVVLARRS